MNNFKKILLAAGLFVLAGSVSATQITGEISFGGSALIDNALQNVDIVSDIAAVTSSSGDLSALIPIISSVAYYDFSYKSPFVIVEPLWEGSGFSFDLLTLQIKDDSDADNGFLELLGTGTLKNAAFDDTDFKWSFSSDRSGTTIAFSSTNSPVPAPGIALIMAIGLAGISVARKARKFA